MNNKQRHKNIRKIAFVGVDICDCCGKPTYKLTKPIKIVACEKCSDKIEHTKWVVDDRLEGFF